MLIPNRLGRVRRVGGTLNAVEDDSRAEGARLIMFHLNLWILPALWLLIPDAGIFFELRKREPSCPYDDIALLQFVVGDRHEAHQAHAPSTRGMHLAGIRFAPFFGAARSNEL